jgi:hypothetical protein
MTTTQLQPAAGDVTVDAINRLTAVLNLIASAMVALDAGTLLAAETDLGSALAQLGVAPPAGDREGVRAAAREAHAALLRCRRLGASFTSAVRAMNQAGEPVVEYTRAGSQIERALSVSVLVRA